jgi:hypothetical protein
MADEQDKKVNVGDLEPQKDAKGGFRGSQNLQGGQSLDKGGSSSLDRGGSSLDAGQSLDKGGSSLDSNQNLS